MSTNNSEDESSCGEETADLLNSPFSYAVYKELARINGSINKMAKPELISKLKQLKLTTEGDIQVIRKRLKSHYKKKKLSKANILLANNLRPYYVIVDFEATCDEDISNYQHEIIEFPAVLVDTVQQKVIDEFRAYCKPVLTPVLSEFCTQLTGITQDNVNEAKEFPCVLNDFEKWLKKHGIGTKHKYAMVTDGPWDMGLFLYGQCVISGIPYPRIAKRWVNIRKIFGNFYKTNKNSLKFMLEHLDMQFEGRRHCGLDDSKNIARVLIRLLADGAGMQINERIRISPQDDGVKPRGNQKNKNVISVKPSTPIKNIIQVRREKSINEHLMLKGKKNEHKHNTTKGNEIGSEVLH